MTTPALYPESKNLETKEKELFFQICDSIKNAKASSNMIEELPYFVKQIPL